MQWVQRNKSIKYLLMLAAIGIAAFFLVFSHSLVEELKQESSSKMAVWADAMAALNNADENTDLDLVLSVLNDNSTIPVIVRNAHGDIEQYRNITVRESSSQDSIDYLRRCAERMKKEGYFIRINYNDTPDGYMEIIYEDSTVLKKLAVFPYVQIAILLVFVIVIIVTLLHLKRAEQNRVWIGLTKETAHQLGTPISSLMAWEEILKESYPDDPVLPEMGKDIARLQLIADRFSKVGSQPEIQSTDLKEVLWHVTDYMTKRLPHGKVTLQCHFPHTAVVAPLCPPLFEWVVENLCKNAVDAMTSKGEIGITLFPPVDGVIAIDVWDTGRGIPKNKFRTIFDPGYTTKKRGWGLGLSLSKRIIEEYHHGRIYVKSSDAEKGTVFRIELKAL
ncbi:MAG: HAMP domain-containing sensor histidine kinase [Prevotellaceae bacterium]|nr:HAMP domain-containing histidine kinase [Prevotellaceae bacterium]MDD7107130.1 HAMP domain-containing sensor histidine kinase [Prevotellaceae bacterium]